LARLTKREKNFLIIQQERKAKKDGYCKPPDIYWSTDFDGNHRMSEVDVLDFGLPLPYLTMKVKRMEPNESDDLFIDTLYEACDFDSNSDELARSSKPPMIKPPSESLLKRRHSVINIEECTHISKLYDWTAWKDTLWEDRINWKDEDEWMELNTHTFRTNTASSTYLDLPMRNKMLERKCWLLRKGYLDLCTEWY